MARAAVLFDLDGTLADSEAPITACMNHALERHGDRARPVAELGPLIGPPMAQAFAQLTGHEAGSEFVAACMSTYRACYATASLRDTTVFEGIGDVLADLAPRYALAVATSKPLAFTEPLLDALALRSAFAVVAGPAMDLITETKADTIARALAQLGRPPAVMVGDRRFDIAGAQANGLPSIGVTWGFGSRDELEAAGASRVVDRPGELPATVAGLLEAP